MGSLRFLAVALTIPFLLASRADAQIYVADTLVSPSVTKTVRVSVKIMNDAAGQRPFDGYYRSEEQILTVFDECNATLAAMNADWRVELVEILDVRGKSQWFGPFDCDLKREFEAHARADAANYFYRFDAINIYVISELTGCGGYCSIPSSGDEVIIINNRVGILNWSLGWLHEIGHYFGLQHTYQCLNRPCESDHNRCTGAGSESRNCPDVCPDTGNIMGGREDLAVGQAIFSPCQMSELARAMQSGNGIRSKVVEHMEIADHATDQCAPASGSSTTNTSPASAATVISGGFIPRAPAEPLPSGTSSSGSSDTTTCETGVDNLPPKVLRIDPQFMLNSQRVIGVVIEFSEAIDVSEVQNGVDIAVTYETTPMDGTISWRDENATLVWTSAKALPAGQYGIFLTSEDKTDFQDRSGNVLQANTEGFFAVGFSLDSQGQLLLPSAATCGAGMLFPGLMMLSLVIAGRRRFLRRG